MERMKIEIPYYEDHSRLNNSALGWFLERGPAFFRDSMDGKEDKLEGSFLEKGTMIHEYILQPDEFWKDYVVLDFEVPKVKQQKDFCEAYASSLELLEDEKKLQAYKSSYSNSKSWQIALKEASELCEKYSAYIEYCKVKDTKKVISFADVNMLKQIKKNLEEHKKANELLFNLPVTFESFNEFHINWEDTKRDIKCKSLLDRVCFDHVNKKIILIDLKTTVDAYNFKKSVETYDYYRQIAFYSLAIQWYMANVLNLNTDDYDFEAYIICIDKSKRNQIRVFDMSDYQTLCDKINLIKDTMQKISEHTKLNMWDHSLEYYNGNGVEKL